jgi:diketogulonate reductase-like aldo/keto reductase
VFFGSGSDPTVGLSPWFLAGGTGIDTAWDYDDQAAIGSLLAKSSKQRKDYFITSKVPAGDHSPGVPGIIGACSEDPNVSLKYVNDTLNQLGVSYVDLVLLHAPCSSFDPPVSDPTKSDNALWQGLVQAKALGLTRAIGVSNYNSKQLMSLEGPTPAVNQGPLSITGFWGKPGHDDATIAYCAANNIVFESYGSLRGCPFADKQLAAIASAHKKSASQVCMRWVLQHGAVIAAGTGSNATTAPAYSAENLDIFDFTLSAVRVVFYLFSRFFCGSIP